jgi:hypothetical protein
MTRHSSTRIPWGNQSGGRHHEAPAPIDEEAQPETLRHTISEATVSLL